MRKLLAIMLGCFALLQAQAQSPDVSPWCPPGAKWTYGYTNAHSPTFHEFTYISDTLINGMGAKVLQRKLVVFAGPDLQGRTEAVVDHIYLRHSKGVVSMFYKGSFHFLYDFGAQVNDQWTLRSPETCPLKDYPEEDIVTVENIREDTIGGSIYTRIVTNSSWHERAYQVGDVYRNIGSVLAPYPVVSKDPAHCDGAPETYGPLACYYDDERGIVLFASASGFPCAQEAKQSRPAALPEAVTRNELLLYPNPAREQVSFLGVDLTHCAFTVHDASGRQRSAGRITGNQLPLTSLPPGTYVLRVEKKGRTYTSKFMKR